MTPTMRWEKSSAYGYDLGYSYVGVPDGVLCGSVYRVQRGPWWKQIGFHWTSGNESYGGGSGWCWTAARAMRCVEQSQASRQWHSHYVEWNPWHAQAFGVPVHD